MILFLNFAPIAFMGGAEKVILEYANTVSKIESVQLIDVSPKIANIYGILILNRVFKSHIKDHKLKQIRNHISLSWSSFIPFTTDWYKVRDIFKTARIVYTRFEFLEIALCLYFGGMLVFSKTVAGLHLTPIYRSPRGIMDLLHNALYGSFLYKFFLIKVTKIHVLTLRDKILLNSFYKIFKNIVVLPIGVDFSHLSIFKKKNKLDELKVIFVGELSTRKGVDTLIKIIKNSPAYISFDLIGDGPLKDDVIKLQDNANCYYHGYVNSDKLSEIYSNSDVLLFPSRAEAFGIVMAEAMAYGAKIVNSSEVSLNLPSYIEESVNQRDSETYIAVLIKIFTEKQKNKIRRNNIRKFALSHFSSSENNKKFVKQIINI